MTLRRGIVQGYDTSLAAPKGVAGAIDVRQSVAAVAQRTGVYWDRDDPCTATGTATMNVDITGFRAALESPLGGFYVVTADDTESVAIAASDSTNARYDIIYVDQEDYQVDGSQVDSEAVLTVATGTPALTPADPSIPSTALALYRVEVPAGVTTTNDVGVVITALFDYTAPVGAPIPIRSLADTSSIVGYTDRRAFTVSDGITYRWNGSTWSVSESGAFTFASGWSAAAAGGGTSSVKKIGSLVTLTIAFKKSTDIAIGGEGVATIPSGFRPPDLVWFAVGLDGATFSGNPTSALARVTSGGAIEVYSATAGKRDVYGAVSYFNA